MTKNKVDVPNQRHILNIVQTLFVQNYREYVICSIVMDQRDNNNINNSRISISSAEELTEQKKYHSSQHGRILFIPQYSSNQSSNVIFLKMQVFLIHLREVVSNNQIGVYWFLIFHHLPQSTTLIILLFFLLSILFIVTDTDTFRLTIIFGLIF